MAENSPTSQKNGKKRTRKTSSLTLDQADEILQQALINAELAGQKMAVGPIPAPEIPGITKCVGIVLFHCDLVDGKIIPVASIQDPPGGDAGKDAPPVLAKVETGVLV